MKYAAFDPGSARCGYALADDDGRFISRGIINGIEDFLNFVETLIAATDDTWTFVVEGYKNRPGRANVHAWSKNETSQVIGALKHIARKNKIPLHEQDPNPGLSIGLKFINEHEKWVGKHVPDDISANAHLEYWLRKNGIKNG